MPTYAYACTKCEHKFDAVQSFTDDALTECPQCAGRLRKLFAAVGIVFKGSGFYRNDSRAAASGNGSKPKPDAGSDAGSDGAKESGSTADAAKSDSSGSAKSDGSGSTGKTDSAGAASGASSNSASSQSSTTSSAKTAS